MNDETKAIIKVLVQGFTDGGMSASFNYPGFFTHELFKLTGGKNIQLSEKHAYAEAFGSSLAGKRTLVSFKNVGLNVAADVFLHSQIAGVGAGLVLLISDDVDVWGSQESQDSRHYMDFNGGILQEPKSLQEAYDMARNSFLISEKFCMPVVIRITNEHLREEDQLIDLSPVEEGPTAMNLKKEDLIVHPYYWTYQYKSLKRKLTRVIESEEFSVDDVKTSNDTLVVSFGAVGSLVSQLDGDLHYDLLHISSLPLPKSARDVIEIDRYKEIIVIEYGQPYLYEKIASIVSVKSVSITPDILANTKEFTEWTRDERLFAAISHLKQEDDKLFVFSDITRSTVESLHVVDASLSYGSAVSTSIGYSKSMPAHHSVISIVGDGSVNHESLDTIKYASKENIYMTVIIVDNGGLWCTGGQIPAVNVQEMLSERGETFSVVDLDSQSVADIQKVISENISENGLSIVVAKTQMGSFRGE